MNADGQLCDDILGNNLFVYCANDPVNKFDPQGEAWWHWALGAAIVAVCAVATVVTCGGFLAAASAVASVSSGVAAATTASTIAAGAFIGSATVYALQWLLLLLLPKAFKNLTIKAIGKQLLARHALPYQVDTFKRGAIQ